MDRSTGTCWFGTSQVVSRAADATSGWNDVAADMKIDFKA